MPKKRENKSGEPQTKYSTEMTYYCPKRGWVTETVEVKRYHGTHAPQGAAKYILEGESVLAEND